MALKLVPAWTVYPEDSGLRLHSIPSRLGKVFNGTDWIDRMTPVWVPA